MPAECAVDVSQDVPTDEKDSYQFLRTVRTNRYGIAKVSELRLIEYDPDDTCKSLILNNQGGGGGPET